MRSWEHQCGILIKQDTYTKWQVAIMTTAQPVYSEIVTPFGLETGKNVCWKERLRRDVWLDPKEDCECCGPPSGPLLFVGPVDFLVDSNNPIHILIDPHWVHNNIICVEIFEKYLLNIPYFSSVFDKEIYNNSSKIVLNE